ncbi:hypothetical protein PCC79_11435 [Propioniciclava soli]|uniref:Lipoprotein n=1 Tax=Propioniciclava soli TaxID=2775081 RepID=A0ABZ3C4T6_9ACTN
MVKPMTAAGAVVCWGVLFAGCTPGVEPTPEPTPEPTFQCTPEAGGDAYGCDQAEFEAMVARDEQYAEAERVYRRVQELQFDLMEAREPMNEELRSLMTGEYLELATSELRDALESGVSYRGNLEVAWVRRATDISDQGSVLALSTCLAPGSLVLTYEGEDSRPTSFQEQVFFKQEDGGLKVASNRVWEVAEC